RVYSAIADRVTLVVGWNLAAQALLAAPSWWEVLLAERRPGSIVHFVPLRDGTPNPGVTAEALAAMLPLEDIRRLARSARISRGSLTGRRLRDVVAAHVSLGELRATVASWFARLSRKREQRTKPQTSTAEIQSPLC